MVRGASKLKPINQCNMFTFSNLYTIHNQEATHHHIENK